MKSKVGRRWRLESRSQMTRIPIVLILLSNIVFCDQAGRTEGTEGTAVASKIITRKEGEHASFQCEVNTSGEFLTSQSQVNIISFNSNYSRNSF